MAYGNSEQTCPVCNRKLELIETKSKAGAAQFGLRCYMHGRKVAWQTTQALALAASVNTLAPQRA